GVEVGKNHLLVRAGEDVGRLGHEVDAAEHHVLGLVVVGGEPGEAEGVAPGVRPAHDLLALVVMAEDEKAVAEDGLCGTDPRRELLGRGLGVAVGKRCLHPHLWVSLWGLRLRPVGTAWSPFHGVVGLGADMSPGYQAGVVVIVGAQPSEAPSCSRSTMASATVSVRMASRDQVGCQPVSARILAMSGTRRCMSSKPVS